MTRPPPHQEPAGTTADEEGRAQAGHTGQLHETNRQLQLELERRIRSEARLTALLKDKEMMLREIHHRVKNNMQVIASLLQLQQRTVSDPATVQALKDSQARIRSMAMIHERLYRTDDMARVDFAAYARELTEDILSASGARERIAVDIDTDAVHLNIEKAIPAGLIINELIANALRHGLPPPVAGKLVVSVCAADQGQVAMRVQDSGCGLPEGLEWRKTETLGLRLVQMLTRQLHGQISLRHGQGTEFQLIFPAA